MSTREPIWTAETMNRKKGDTTFKQCGWCEYQGCGSYRHDTMLSGSCNLLRSYSNEVEFDTPCKIAVLGKEDIKSIIKSKKYYIHEKESGIESLNEQIGVLNSLMRKAKGKPPLPDSREQDFELKDVVYVFHEKKWNRGVVVNGYRHKDGCVSYVLDDYPASQKGWGCGVSVPCVLKEWEFKYFKKNLEDFREWLRLSDRIYNGDKLDLESYYQAMEKP